MNDITIIGSGPAGYSAAIYASRALLATGLLMGSQPGGQLTTTTVIENYPGFPDGIDGTVLMDAMKKQAERFGTIFYQLEARRIIHHLNEKYFSIETEKETLETRSIIVATGAQAKKLGIPSEEMYRGKGVSYCATCDGFFFRGKNIAVIGGGDTAMEEAIFLSTIAGHVTILNRSDRFKASPIMLEKARKNPAITIMTNVTVGEFYGNTTLEGIHLLDATNGTPKDLVVSGAFIAIGHIPATEFIRGLIDSDKEGYIQTKAHSSREAATATALDGIFVAGDCSDPRYRQGIVAAGMGAMAAIDAQRYLEA